MKLNSSSQQRNLKYEFHYLPKLVLITIKWRKNWHQIYGVSGVSKKSWEFRSLGSLEVSNHELYLCQIVLSATRRCSFPCLECPLIVLRNKYCIYTSRQRCNTDVISIDYCLLTSGKKWDTKVCCVTHSVQAVLQRANVLQWTLFLHIV